MSPKVSEDVSPKVVERVAQGSCFSLLPVGLTGGE